MSKALLTTVGVIVALLVLSLVIKQIFFSIENQEPVRAHWNTFENKQIGIQFNYPDGWEIGDSKRSMIYWTAVPKYKSQGNVVLKVVSWKLSPDFPSYTEDRYKGEILSSSFYYKALNFISFQNHIKIDGVPGIFAYYKADGVLKDKVYYEMVAQWWIKDLLFTLQGQFSEPELTRPDLDQFIDILKSIKLDKKINKGLSL